MGIPKINEIPSCFNIKLRDVLILYYNLYQAKNHPELGYQDADNQFTKVLRVLDLQEVQISHKELEGLLWASVQLDEVGGNFWHPAGVAPNVFITRMIHHKKFKFYFDKIYSFFRARKPKQGTPLELIVSSEDEES